MIKLSFLFNREVLNFMIQDRVIRYKDRRWLEEIQCIPKDEKFVQRIIMSRNKLPNFLIDLFNLTEEEQAEYDNAKSDEELAGIIIRDAGLKGCQLIGKEEK